MSQLSQLKFAEFAYRGRLCVYLGMTDDRCLFRSGDGWTLEVPDTDTGMPVWPTEAQALALMTSMDLIVRAKPLDDPIRQRARRLERTRQQLIDATVKDGSKRKRDHWFTLRERVKPWGVIFSRMLTDASATDRIAFSMTGGSINRICISAADARALRNLDLRHTQPGVIAPRCSQRDALEILNLPAKHAHLLKRFAGADDEWLMDWGDVLRFAGDRITLTEMSARVDMNGAKLEALLESEGCPRSDDFGWLRTSALKALSRT